MMAPLGPFSFQGTKKSVSLLNMAAIPSRCILGGEEGQEKSPRSFF